MTAIKERYHFFKRYRSYADIMLNHHEIEKAIRHAVGVRDFDKRIKKIWKRVLNKKNEYPKNIYNRRY